MEYFIGYSNLCFFFNLLLSSQWICLPNMWLLFPKLYKSIYAVKNTVELLLTLALCEMLWTSRNEHNMVSMPKEFPE